MNKVYIQNLGMIVTNQCNLNCKHCLRGCHNNQKMTNEVIKATLKQIVAIGNLCICGGEPTLALDVLENIFCTIMENKILVSMVTITINGTNYSVEFLKLLDIMKDYCENVKRYAESKYFYELRTLDKSLKLFREGNAEYLDKSLTIPVNPIDIVITYVGKFSKFDREGLCNIGPFITINPEGIITEDNTSIFHQKSVYNYGNILTDSLEEVALKRGRIVKPKTWNKETDKIIKNYVKS